MVLNNILFEVLEFILGGLDEQDVFRIILQFPFPGVYGPHWPEVATGCQFGFDNAFGYLFCALLIRGCGVYCDTHVIVHFEHV